MRERKNGELLIDLKDLFYHLLYRWRSILLVALAGAVILCANQYLSVKKVHDKGELTREEKQHEADVQEYNLALKDAQNKVESYAQLIRAGNEYRSESILRKLNLNNVWTAEQKYIVRVDQGENDTPSGGGTVDPADSVVSVYSAAMGVDANETELKEAFGTTSLGYASEVVVIVPSTADNTVTVQVMGDTEEEAEKRMAYVDKRITQLKEGQAQEICKHELITVEGNTKQGVYKPIGDGIALSQQMREDDIQQAEYMEELKSYQSTLIRLTEQGEPGKPGLHLPRMAVIGAMLGGLLMLFIYSIKYVAQNRLRLAGMLPAEYGVPVYGDFASSRARRPGKGIDKLIEKREFRNSQTDPEIIYGNACAMMSRTEGGKILLVSSLPEEEIRPVTEELCQRLKGKAAIETGVDFVNNSDAIEKTREYDTVILIEKKHRTGVRQLNRMAEILNIEGVKASGVIVL